MPRESLEVKDDRAKRLELARKNKGFKSAKEACEYNGWKTSTYLSHESGERSYFNMAALYAKAFGVSAGWLVFGENPPAWLDNDTLSPFNTNTFVESQKIPFVTYTELLDLYYGKVNMGSITAKNQLVDAFGVSQYTDRLLYLTLDQETNTSEISRGDDFIVSMDADIHTGDLLVAKVPVYEEPQIMELFLNEQSQPCLKYITNFKNSSILDTQAIAKLGRIVKIAKNR